MESTINMGQRMDTGALLEFANTPPTIVTETTSTSDQKRLHLSSFRSPTSASTMINNTSSDSLPHPLYSEDGELPDEVMSYFEHWASPTEVLQLRSMCADLVNRHKNESKKLHQEMEEVKRGRDTLLRELQELRNLRGLYLKATDECESVRKERSQWREERELLRLQIQRLSVENQRLHQALGRSRNPRLYPHGWAHAAVSSSAGGGGRSTPTAVPTSGSSITTPSLTSSSAAQQTRGVHHQYQQQHHQHQQQQHQQQHSQLIHDHYRRHHYQHHQQQQAMNAEFGSGCGMSNTSMGDEYGQSTLCSLGSIEDAMREQLRLMEELHRSATECAELDARFQFSQTLWELSEMRREQRTILIVSENEKLKGQLQHWKAAAEDAFSHLDATKAQLRDCHNDLEDARHALQAAHMERQMSLEAEHHAAEDATVLLKAAHAEELLQVKQQLQVALDDAVRTRETLRKAMDTAQRQAEAHQEQLLADVEVAEQRCRSATTARDEAVAALAEKVTLHEREQEQLKHQLLFMESAQKQCIKEKTEQVEMLSALKEEQARLEVCLHDTEEELQVVTSRLTVALEKLQQCGELEEELCVMRARAESAESEVQTQQSYYAEQLRLHQTALADLQQQRDVEVLRLGRTIERLQRRCEAGRIRLAAAVKKSAGLISTAAVKGGLVDGQAQQQEGLEERVNETAPESVQPDAVALLQQSAAIAATLARTIHRSGLYTS